MPKFYCHNDTIAAISTPIGQGGIGIVRMSGPDALKIADRIFKPARSKGAACNGRLTKVKTFSLHYGWIVSRRQKTDDRRQKKNNLMSDICSLSSEIIDEVVVSVMRSPRSYTKEDIVEINCHSGIVNLQKILDLVLQNGARLAEPGEFTRRAFLNGRIDLTQAEAVLDIIQAKTEESLRVGLEQLKGRLSDKINHIRAQLLNIFAHLEASIDFPEEDIDTRSINKIKKDLISIEKEIENLLKNSSEGRILREGVKVVIAGTPNVGKSSLLNAFLKEERVIVTPIPGTTRDAVEEVLNVKGIPIRLFDTAGIIEPRDLIEDKAVAKSRAMMNSADLILLMLDGSHKLTKKDGSFIKDLKDKNKLIVINKTDLPQKINLSKLKSTAPDNKIIKISALKLTGIKELERGIVKKVLPSRIGSDESIIVSNSRHINYLRQTLEALKKVQGIIDKGLTAEVISIEIKDAINNLDYILGRSVDEDLLDKIFSEFCVGK